jgi:hypothetical protein
MKKVDVVLKKLSDLYEFNRKIKTYEFKAKMKGQPNAQPDRENVGGADATESSVTKGTYFRL